MKLIATIMLFSLVTLSYGQSDNMIHNAGFEDPGDVNDPRRSGLIDDRTVDGVSHTGAEVWIDRLKVKDDIPKHSPDWYSIDFFKNNLNQNIQKFSINTNNGKLMPNEGKAYMGMNTCELVQQRLFKASEFEVGEDYYISMFVRRAGAGLPGVSGASSQPARLKVYASKSKFNYSTGSKNKNNYCEGKYCKKDAKTRDVTKKKVILNTVIDLATFPVGSWVFIQNQFVMDVSFAYRYNWIVMELEPINGNFCDSYLLFDQVSIRKGACQEECIKGCSPTDGPVENVQIQNIIAAQQPFTVDGIDNMHSAQLTIYANALNQSPVYTSPVIYCSNGIKQRLEFSLPSLAAGAYFYDVSLENDCFERCPVTGRMLKLSAFSGTITPFNCYSGPIIVPKPCCASEPDVYIDNVVFPSTQNFTDGFTFNYKALNKIHVGTQGNVQIATGSEVTFQAAVEVIQGPYFDCPSEFLHCFIAPCAQCKYSYAEYFGEDTIQYPGQVTEPILIETWTTDVEVEVEKPRESLPELTVSVYPNPSDGRTAILRFEGALVEKVHISIVDLQGIEIHQEHIQFDTGEHTLQLNFRTKLSAGVYLVRITSGNREFLKKLIVE